MEIFITAHMYVWMCCECGLFTVERHTAAAPCGTATQVAAAVATAAIVRPQSVGGVIVLCQPSPTSTRSATVGRAPRLAQRRCACSVADGGGIYLHAHVCIQKCMIHHMPYSLIRRPCCGISSKYLYSHQGNDICSL